jgi:hypothetical protein
MTETYLERKRSNFKTVRKMSEYDNLAEISSQNNNSSNGVNVATAIIGRSTKGKVRLRVY